MEKLFKNIAQSNLNTKIRNFAVGKLNNQETLYRIVVEEKDWKICTTALNKLNGKSLFPKIAEEAKCENTRKMAVKEVNDIKILERIALNEPFHEVCIEAIKKIEDDEILAKIAKNSKSIRAKISAIEKLKDEQHLINFANSKESDSIRKAAIKNLENDEVLQEIALREDKLDLQITAIDSITDQQKLIEIALNSSQSLIRERINQKLDKSHKTKFAELMKNMFSDELVKIDLENQTKNLPKVKFDFKSYLEKAISFRNKGFKSILYYREEYTEEIDTGVPNPDFSVREANDGYVGTWCGNPETIYEFNTIPERLEIKQGDLM
ncbi:MAG: hypothetical protein AAGA77_25045 [Bacteroidota bacterium]